TTIAANRFPRSAGPHTRRITSGGRRRSAVRRARAGQRAGSRVKNNQGQMIELATLLKVRSTSGPVQVMNYNLYSAVALTGTAAPGTSSSQAVALMEQIARQMLPRSMGYDLTPVFFYVLGWFGRAKATAQQPPSESAWPRLDSTVILVRPTEIWSGE